MKSIDIVMFDLLAKVHNPSSNDSIVIVMKPDSKEDLILPPFCNVPHEY